MDAGTSLARQTRIQHRHELRTLTYVTIDQANGGIVRNLTHHGIGVQAVAALRPQQQLRVRFELRYPRLRVEVHGEVMWSTSSGQCGIRFLDLPRPIDRQIQEWIFGNLLEGCAVHADRTASMFAVPATRSSETTEDDGLLVSATSRGVIELAPLEAVPGNLGHAVLTEEDPVALDWLSQPFSGPGLTWTVNALAVIAGLLLFALVFLSVTHETPSWQVMIAGAFFVPFLYWGFFQLFGGSSLGARLARLAARDQEEEDERTGARFR
jgi:PilZ domain